MATYTANWTGCYPSLCIGHWQLFKDGVNVTKFIPKSLLHESMYTRGEYRKWEFDEDYLEVFENYRDGLKETEWIKKNKGWLAKISDDPVDYPLIFRAFQTCDWRYGSCGGCI